MNDYQSAIHDLPEFLMNRFHPDDLTVAEQIADIIHRKKGIRLEENLLLTPWTRLCELSQSFPDGCRVILRSAPPADWPQLSNARVIVYDRWMYERASEFTSHLKRYPHYHHGVDQPLSYHFYIPYGSEQYERERVFRAIEDFGLTQQSLYSRPLSDLKIIPVFSFQESDHNIEHRTLEKENARIDSYQRFNHLGNFKGVQPIMIQCHCAVIMDNFCFNDDYSGYLTEKMLYPVAAGIPWIYAGNRYHRENLSQRGFRPHLPMAETAEALIHQMLWLQAVFQNPDMARRWQEQQGETIIHNQNQLRSLKDIIDKEARF